MARVMSRLAVLAFNLSAGYGAFLRNASGTR